MDRDASGAGAIVFVLIVGLLTGCATPERPGMDTVTGSVACRERVELPANAVLQIALIEVNGGATGGAIVEKNIPGPGRVPATFTLVYDPRTLIPGRQYAVQARITLDGKPWFLTQTVNHQMQGSRIVHADILLQPAR